MWHLPRARVKFHKSCEPVSKFHFVCYLLDKRCHTSGHLLKNPFTTFKNQVHFCYSVGRTLLLVSLYNLLLFPTNAFSLAKLTAMIFVLHTSTFPSPCLLEFKKFVKMSNYNNFCNYV